MGTELFSNVSELNSDRVLQNMGDMALIVTVGKAPEDVAQSYLYAMKE